MALIRTANNQWIWRSLMAGLGLLLYVVSVRRFAWDLRWVDTKHRVWRLIGTAYLAAGVIAYLGAVFDPRGSAAILHDALPTGLGSTIGMLFIPGRWPMKAEAASETIKRSPGWMVAGVILAAIYIFGLGRGIPFRI